MTYGPPTTAAPPGWYDDPEAPDLLRWWDGRAWSDEHFATKPVGDAQNAAARRARSIFVWAWPLAVLFWVVPLLLTLIPDSAAQTVGVVMSWIGGLPVLVLTVLSIVFGAIGLANARRLGGIGRRAALTGLVGGVCILVAPAVLGGIGIVFAFLLAAFR
ncbi:DUF2510 domain-containing protein [Agromyces sp. NPDC058136]|uniref:DUF2510 domain-containing protein n=1 Tax=Agromyces sp. NPDC058136 TaxID=3346354 RepID=UPI0036DF635B